MLSLFRTIDLNIEFDVLFNEHTMIEKILDREIEEILRENPRRLIPLTEIKDKLNENRKRKGKDPVSKTTIYTKLMKLVDQKKLHHINRKGYKLLNYEFTETDPNFKLFKIYKNIIEAIGFIWVSKSGNIKEDPDIMDNFKEEIDEEEWNDLKNNYKKLVEQGILELKHHYKDSNLLSVSYYWALYHEICPVCLEKIDLNKPHFAFEFVENEAAYIQLTKTHIYCVEQILNRYELREEYESDTKYDPFDEFKFEDTPHFNIGFICPYCGLTTDLYDLFLNESGPLDKIYNKFLNSSNNMNNDILQYLQNLCKELFGDISTLTWAKQIPFKKKVRLVIRKIVMVDGVVYHPNCWLRMKKDPYYKNEVEVRTVETTE